MDDAATMRHMHELISAGDIDGFGDVVAGDLIDVLAPDELLVDTQPVSARPPVVAEGAVLGRLDMRAWVDTIRAVDECLDETITGGLSDLRHEQHFVVTDSFYDGRACLDSVSSRRETSVPPSLAFRLEAVHAPVSVEQEVRLRLVRRAQSILRCH